MPDWDTIFRRDGKVFERPQEDMAAIIRLLKKSGAKRVLDLGCGTGRHTVLLASKGFEVTGIDVSPEALRQARAWLKEKSLRARLVKRNFYDPLPFKYSSFDAIVAVQTMHHNHHKKVLSVIGEMARVLRPGGILFVTVPRKSGFRLGSHMQKIAEHTYVPTQGLEAGVVHYMYTRRTMRRDFRDFEIIGLHLDSGEHLCLLARAPTLPSRACGTVRGSRRGRRLPAA